jgi:hypothetical protein
LPGLEAKSPAVRQIDEKAALDDQEELIRGWMVMPGVVPVEDNKSQAVLVHTIDHDVAVTIGRLSTLDDQVYYSERRISHRLVPVRLGSDRGVVYHAKTSCWSEPPLPERSEARPNAPRSTHRWHPNDGEGADEERAHGEWHDASEAVLQIHSAGREIEEDLHRIDFDAKNPAEKADGNRGLIMYQANEQNNAAMMALLSRSSPLSPRE